MIKKIGKKRILIISTVIVIIIVSIIAGILIWNNIKTTSKLTCTNETNQTDMKTTSNITIKFRKDKIQTMNINTKIQLSGTFKENIENMYSALIKGTEEDYKEVKGINVKSNKTDDTIQVNITANIIENASLVSEASQNLAPTMTLDQAKQTLEKDGYICK